MKDTGRTEVEKELFVEPEVNESEKSLLDMEQEEMTAAKSVDAKEIAKNALKLFVTGLAAIEAVQIVKFVAKKTKKGIEKIKDWLKKEEDTEESVEENA